MTCQIIHGDCKAELQNLINLGIQIDSIVTDPPYELGFMNKEWDNTGIAYDVEMWKLCLEILKPGGHLLSFGGSRTYHRMACAIEDAGFEIRDQIMWIYGQGFPKSLDISKAIDKKAKAKREILGYKSANINRPQTNKWKISNQIIDGDAFNGVKGQLKAISLPVTDLAKQWDGWGTALKPAHEPIVLARKPLLEKTVAENVIKHGTGGINIDGCRVGVDGGTMKGSKPQGAGHGIYGAGLHGSCDIKVLDLGRFPANLIHDGSDDVEEEFAKYGESKSIRAPRNKLGANVYGGMTFNKTITGDNGMIRGHNDFGLASRFFYCAKASKKDRLDSKHPTVKPLSLMRYLCRLITPPNGTILDPFAGTGTTGQAALEESFKAILIEKEDEYIQDIKKRINSMAKTLF